MSIFSGKCDLYDTLMMQHFRTAEGSDKKEDLDKARVYYSDEYECFNEFKEATNGTLYQHKKIDVNLDNQDMVASMCKNFEVIELPLEPNQRKPRNTYKYYDKEYKSLKEINKKGVYITLEIHFNTILNLIPYYPYIVSAMFSNEDQKIVYISDEPYTIEERDNMLKIGYVGSLGMYEYYTKQLQEHYIEVVQRYYTPNPNALEYEEVEFEDKSFADEYIGKLRNKIDPRFPIKWCWEENGKEVVKNHWSDPEIVDYEKGIIKANKYDIEQYGNKMVIKYYIYQTPKKYLD